MRRKTQPFPVSPSPFFFVQKFLFIWFAFPVGVALIAFENPKPDARHVLPLLKPLFFCFFSSLEIVFSYESSLRPSLPHPPGTEIDHFTPPPTLLAVFPFYSLTPSSPSRFKKTPSLWDLFGLQWNCLSGCPFFLIAFH